MIQAADEQGVIEILQLFGGKVLGVEAVLAGVLVAGLGAALALAGDVVEGALGWGVRAGEGFEEGFDCIHGRRVAGGWGFGQWVDVRAFLAFGGRGLGEGGLGTLILSRLNFRAGTEITRWGVGAGVSEVRWTSRWVRPSEANGSHSDPPPTTVPGESSSLPS